MKLFPGFAELYHDRLPHEIRQYLNARGIPDPTIEEAQLGWHGERITIPVYDREGELVLYKLGKAPHDPSDSPKMLYDPPGVTAELYGWETLRKNPSEVIVCEGEYDRLVLEARGFPAVTGTSGAATFREEWAREIAKVPRVYVCFDNDLAGRKGAERVGGLIPHARTVVLPPEVGDSGDVTDFFVRLGRSREEFRALLAAAVPLPPQVAPDGTRPASAHSPDPEIRRLKEAVRIEEVVAQYLPLRTSGRTLMARCCFHEDREPSLAVFPETQSFYCFGCGKHGDVLSFLMAVEDLAFPEALRILKHFAARS
jgi:DNA primase